MKLIASLSQKKFRDETNLFLAEGTKLVLDLAPAFRCSLLVATTTWLKDHALSISAEEIVEVDEGDLVKTSNQKSPQGVLAVFVKPTYTWTPESLTQNLCLALDDVQDPGNLGTILRVADWFGIRDVFCSEHTADPFSPKTVQATMGALARVRVHIVRLAEFLQACPAELPIYGTFMDGKDIYTTSLEVKGMVVMGNEGNGISEEIERCITERLLIPNFPLGQVTSESLNVGVATALVCAEFRRRQI